jgi:Rod binding domain-containing protein
MVDAITVAGPVAMEQRGKLQKATQDFEAMLLADLLKSGPKMGTVDGNPEDGGAERYADFSMEAVASGMAAQGGIGIGRMLLKQLGPSVHGTDIKDFSSAADSSIARVYTKEASQ